MDTSSLDILSQLPQELQNTCKPTFTDEGVTARYARVKMVNEFTDDMRKISPKIGKMLSTKT